MHSATELWMTSIRPQKPSDAQHEHRYAKNLRLFPNVVNFVKLPYLLPPQLGHQFRLRFLAGIVKTAVISGGDVGMEIDHYKHLRELGLAVGENKNPSLRELLEDVSGEIKSLDQEARLKPEGWPAKRLNVCNFQHGV